MIVPPVVARLPQTRPILSVIGGILDGVAVSHGERLLYFRADPDLVRPVQPRREANARHARPEPGRTSSVGHYPGASILHSFAFRWLLPAVMMILRPIDPSGVAGQNPFRHVSRGRSAYRSRTTKERSGWLLSCLLMRPRHTTSPTSST